MRIVKYKCDRCGREMDSPCKIFPERIDPETEDYCTEVDDPLCMPIRLKDFCPECIAVAVKFLNPLPGSLEEIGVSAE